MKWTMLLALVFAVPAVSFSKPAGTKPRPDQEVRTILRKKAPFWLQDAEVEVRLNKDGTFATESAAAPVIEGKWRVEKSELKLVWNSDKHEKVYPVEIINRAPMIAGAPLKDGRFVISAGQ